MDPARANSTGARKSSSPLNYFSNCVQTSLPASCGNGSIMVRIMNWSKCLFSVKSMGSHLLTEPCVQEPAATQKQCELGGVPYWGNQELRLKSSIRDWHRMLRRLVARAFVYAAAATARREGHVGSIQARNLMWAVRPAIGEGRLARAALHDNGVSRVFVARDSRVSSRSDAHAHRRA
jgi:hypothetical protein